MALHKGLSWASLLRECSFEKEMIMKLLEVKHSPKWDRQDSEEGMAFASEAVRMLESQTTKAQPGIKHWVDSCSPVEPIPREIVGFAFMNF